MINLLSEQLTGKAIETDYDLPVEQTMQYVVLKEALLQRYQLTEATFRTKFFDNKAEITENAIEFLSRIDVFNTLDTVSQSRRDIRRS